MSIKLNYCPRCFAEIPPAAERCPVCGVEITQWRQHLPYPERLVHALDHPLADVRMRAIIALGKRGETAAIQALVKASMAHPSDVVEGIAIVNALAQMPAGAARLQALNRLAQDHPAHAVRERAAEAASTGGEQE